MWRPLLLAKDHASSGWVNPFCQMVTLFYAHMLPFHPSLLLFCISEKTKQKNPFTTMWWNHRYSKHHMEVWLNNMLIFVLGTVCLFYFHNPVKSQYSQRKFQICNTLKLFNLDVYSKVSGRFQIIKCYWYWWACFQQRNDGWLGPNGNTQLCNRNTSIKGAN